MINPTSSFLKRSSHLIFKLIYEKRNLECLSLEFAFSNRNQKNNITEMCIMQELHLIHQKQREMVRQISLPCSSQLWVPELIMSRKKKHDAS